MEKKKRKWDFIIGFLAGIISGFFSSGGGLILVPYLTHVRKMDEVKSRATTIFCIFFMVLISGFFYLKESYVDYEIAVKSAFGGIVGGIIGSKILWVIDEKILKILFIIFLLYASFKMF